MPETRDSSDEISFVDILAILLNGKKIIIAVTGGFVALALTISIMSKVLPPDDSFMPDFYKPAALLVINDSASNDTASLLSSSGMSEVAKLAGVNLSGSGSNAALAVYLTGTNSFLDAIIDRFGLLEKAKNQEKEVKRSSIRSNLRRNFDVSVDSESGVLSISYKDIDPAHAQSVVNFAVDYLDKRFAELGLDKNRLSKENLEKNIRNTYAEIIRLENESQNLNQSIPIENGRSSIQSVALQSRKLELELKTQQSLYTQLKTQYEILKVTMSSETPVFQVLEYAEVLDQKSGPSRANLCVIISAIGFFVSITLVFFVHAWSGLRSKLQLASMSITMRSNEGHE